ncbi:hypothetical protein B5S28_g3437 [[Candida] boidinii]|nr:hypothetical protein B5S28_g3437 [[Candida] boidinii]
MTVNSVVDTPSSKTQTPTSSSYIQQRLDNLYDIDTKVVSLLDNLSCALNNLQEGKKDSKLLVNPNNNNNNNNNNSTAAIASAKIKRDEKLSKLKENCSLFYSNLSDAAILLRKEIKLLDNRSSGNNNNTTTTKNGDNSDSNSTNILPVTVNKKAIWMGKAQMDTELNELDKLVKDKVIKKEQLDFTDSYVKIDIEQAQSQPQAVKSIEDKDESMKVKKEEEQEPMVGIKQEPTTVSDPVTEIDSNTTANANVNSNETSIDKTLDDAVTSKIPESSTKIKNENTETLDISNIPQEIPIKEVSEVDATATATATVAADEDDDAEIDLDDADLDDLFSGENNDVGGNANDQVLLDDDDLFGDVGNLDDGDTEMGFTS